jgi:hypothetical protein
MTSEDKEIEVTPESEIKIKELDYIKNYILDKLMDKPLGQLNCCYTLIENFYAVDNNSSIYDYGKSDPQNRIFFDHKMHSNSHKSSNIIPSPKDGLKETTKHEEDKFNTIEHKNYEISTLE